MTESIRPRRSADIPALAGGPWGRLTPKEGLEIAPTKRKTAARIRRKELRCVRILVNLTPLVANLMPPNLRLLILQHDQIPLYCESQQQHRGRAQSRQSEDHMSDEVSLSR